MGNYGKKVWGWMMYDWAAQPYNTLLITFIFAPYFTSAVVGDPVAGQSMWGIMLAIVGITLAFMGPVSGAIADTTGPRKPWVLLFSVFYVVGALALWWAVPGMNSVTGILIMFGLGMLGMEMSQVFVNSMLPDMGETKDLGRIGGNAWALGYVGGLLLLFIMLLFLAENEEGKTLLGNSPLFGLDAEARQGTRSVGPVTALWYIIFMIPFFAWVPDTKKVTKVSGAISKAFRELGATIKRLPENVSFASYLVSSMFYRDALLGLYGFGGIYASGVLGWSLTSIGIFGIISGIFAAIFTYIGGFADKAYGPKWVITVSVLVLIVVCILIIGTSRDQFFGVVLSDTSTFPDKLFFVCGAAIGAAGGALQSASRTMLVLQADEDRMTEAFGLYALAGRATAWMAPSLIALVTYLTQNQRLGISPVVVLFLIGLCLLFWVETDKD
jgi:UMF1 family MFS transporter